MPLCTYFNRIVSLYLAKMYEWSFGDKQMSRVPKCENFWDTLYHHQKWYCLQISYVLDMVDNDSEVPNFPGSQAWDIFWDTLYNCRSIEIRGLCALILIELCACIWRKCMNDLLGTSRCPEFQSVEIFETPCTIVKSDTVFRFLMF